MRRTRVAREVIAGCLQCGGADAIWHSANAQAVAAKHHDKTGHETWVDISMSIRYGGEATQAVPSGGNRK
jgi:hypothetical protein